MRLTTTIVSFEKTSERLSSLWIHACQLQLAALRDDSGDRWEETAHAWAHLARETPMSARMDLVVYWNLAAEAATKARARSAPGAAAFPWGDGR